MARLIKHDGTTQDVHPADGDTFSLKELQGFVHGYIEVLPVGESYMFMNEEGKLKGLPLNQLATQLTRHRLARADVIVGDVLVCSGLEAGVGEE